MQTRWLYAARMLSDPDIYILGPVPENDDAKGVTYVPSGDYPYGPVYYWYSPGPYPGSYFRGRVIPDHPV